MRPDTTTPEIEPHTIDNNETYGTSEKTVNNMQTPTTTQQPDTPHIIPMKEELWDKTKHYIHKYDMHL